MLEEAVEEIVLVERDSLEETWVEETEEDDADDEYAEEEVVGDLFRHRKIVVSKSSQHTCSFEVPFRSDAFRGVPFSENLGSER
jgi:nucleosome binding factor SPN SPT16 subunit